ncbi:MAG: hypothetical protein JST54_27265 [Deltaproteobacteria bacterium]|nr:hypothetical protein [Deltaproteobacteria bacterium]
MVRKTAFAAVLLGVGFAGGALASPRDHLGKITGAQKHLEAAQMSLGEAGDDFGGHKSKAQQLIKDAQSELNLAVQFAQH